MSDQKFRKYYVEWWEIKTSTIYVGVAILFLTIVAIGGGIWLYQNDWVIQPPAEEAPKNAARIISFQGDIRIIRVGTRKTEQVVQETYVQAGDTIQTQSDGRAQIRMIDGSVLSIRPNSTVVIRDSKSILGGTSVRVKLDDGQIRVKTEDQSDKSDNIVEVKETENRLSSQTDASFNLDEEGDRGEIRISRGSVEAEAEGVKTVIREDEYAAIKDGKVTGKERLLRSPALDSPANAGQILNTAQSRSVPFKWKRPEGDQELTFHLQVARSPFFVSDKIVVEKTALTGTSFVAGELPAGTYFWRVRAEAGSGQQSEWSEPARFTIVQKTTSRRIQASGWQVESLGGSLYRVSGKTQPGATVRILGRETFARSDGSFLLQVNSNSNSVAVEIYDERGSRGRYTLNLRTGRAG